MLRRSARISQCADATDCREETSLSRSTSVRTQKGYDWNPRYNIAPTQPVPVIRQNPNEPNRELSLLRWGLIPSWTLLANSPSMAICRPGSESLGLPRYASAGRPYFICVVLHIGCGQSTSEHSNQTVIAVREHVCEQSFQLIPELYVDISVRLDRDREGEEVRTLSAGGSFSLIPAPSTRSEPLSQRRGVRCHSVDLSLKDMPQC